MCIISTFVTPAALHVLHKAHRRATANTAWFYMLDALLPPILKPLPAENPSITSSASGTAVRYVNGTSLLFTAFTFFGLLLTFGAMFPPLGIAFLVTILAVFCSTSYNITNFLNKADSAGRLQHFLDAIKRDCAVQAPAAVVHGAMWMLITSSCWFYTLFLFDILGDRVGLQGAYWVLIVMPLMPVLLYAVHFAYCNFTTRSTMAAMEQEGRKSNFTDVADIERVEEVEFGELSGRAKSFGKAAMDATAAEGNNIDSDVVSNTADGGEISSGHETFNILQNVVDTR